MCRLIRGVLLYRYRSACVDGLGAGRDEASGQPQNEESIFGGESAVEKGGEERKGEARRGEARR